MKPTIEDAAEFDRHLSSFIKSGDHVSILLDYDGTLAPLADHPNNTVMDADSEATLHRLASQPNVTLAFISGRGVDDVRAKIALPNVTYAGNHGLEIIYANGTRWQYTIPDAVQQALSLIIADLNGLAGNGGAWLENKGTSLTFHYRDVAGEAEQQRLHREAERLIVGHGYLASPAHAAIEAKPPVHWNKGEAALQILREHFGETWNERTRAVFAGDDTTDEDAMRSLQGRGRSFRVSARADIETEADYRLPSTKTVAVLLQWIETAIASK